MKVNKLISLDKETSDIVEKRFPEGTFSEWVRIKIREEQQKEDSLDFLRKKVIDLSIQIEQLQADRAVIQKRIQLKMDEEDANARRILRDEEEEANDLDILARKIFNKIGVILLKNKIVLPKESARAIAESLSMKYVKIDEPKPELENFVLSEVKV